MEQAGRHACQQQPQVRAVMKLGLGSSVVMRTRPEDYSLQNKLGATLASSGRRCAPESSKG